MDSFFGGMAAHAAAAAAIRDERGGWWLKHPTDKILKPWKKLSWWRDAASLSCLHTMIMIMAMTETRVLLEGAANEECVRPSL